MNEGKHSLCICCLGRHARRHRRSEASAKTSKKLNLEQTETRLQAIYDRDEFRAKRYRADRKWIASAQSDDSKVKLRSVLVPGDPTYATVKEVPFARVGEAIPTLRVVVVDAQGKETRRLSVAMPAYGFYLGQLEWAATRMELRLRS